MFKCWLDIEHLLPPSATSKRMWKHRNGLWTWFELALTRIKKRQGLNPGASVCQIAEVLTTNDSGEHHYATNNGDGDAQWCSDGDRYATSNEPQFSQLLLLAPPSAHEYRWSVPSRLRLDLKRYLRLRSRQRARSATAISS